MARVMRWTVRFEIDPTGWWVVTVPRVRGCLTQGRTLAQGLRRIREALALFVGDAAAARAVLVPDVALPAGARKAIARLERVRISLRALQNEAAALSRKAAAILLGDVGLSVRDAAELLELSHQRVHQLARTR